jgi:bifunctional non-homologous end joining protein LigD
MSLKAYQAKRNFRKTREPKPKAAKPHRQPIFVVQEHHARRLHYDFRLEADGVLKSWAVPKEPSMDPAQKRLAVHAEDHPLEYAKFKGTIPEGEYGGGEVLIWDKGTYENLLAEKPTPQSVTEGIESGHVEVNLHGKRLKGRFALVHMHGRMRGKDNWLLIKMKDEMARPEPSGNGQAASHTRRQAQATALANRSQRGRQSVASKRGSAPRVTKVAKPPQDPVQFTHLEKVMFPQAGISKGDVLTFYLQIAPRLLPFLRDRPATLERLPDGIGNGKAAPHFWQKNTPASYPSWIRRIEMPAEGGKNVNYVLINNAETLLYLVNQGTLTFHVWFSRVEELDRPDFVLFDIDVSQATFADAVAVTGELHLALKKARNPAFLKTSGKSGLHVLVPWKQYGGYDEARAWALEMAEGVVQALPDRATTERSKSRRGRRVYVDVMQNAKGRHVAPPYVLRAVPFAGVSTPLRWTELTPKLDPAEFTIKTILRRVGRQKRDPFENLLKSFA